MNLIDWITGSLGKNTGATDLAMGSSQPASKKASVTFAEQKSVSKRIGWGAQPFQDMMADLGKAYIWGLKEHMPSKMAIRLLGEGGYDWDEITRLDLNTDKDVDVFVESADKQVQESEIKKEKRIKALSMLDPNFVNPVKKNEEILTSVGEYDELEVAEFLDMKNYSDKKAIAKASESIQQILLGVNPLKWYGANIAFVQRIVDFASDKRSTLGDKFKVLVDYAMEHKEIVQGNIDRQVLEDSSAAEKKMLNQPLEEGGVPPSNAENPGVSGGVSRAMSVAENAIE